MKLIQINKFTFKKTIFNIKYFVFLFLIWNIFKLFQIKADPIIQLLNALLSIGIYFDIEDKDIKLNIKLRSFFMGIILFLIVFIRSLLLTTVADKFYYLLLPFGIFSICLLAKNFRQKKYFRNIIFISLLLPFRRVFFYIFNPLLLFLTKHFTFFLLFSLGVDPVLINRSIYLGNSELVISDGCGGADNMYFVISTVIIYFLNFRLRNKINLTIIFLITFLVPLFSNIFRNTLLALIITLETDYRDILFNFFHESYGSLTFSFISVSIVSYIYFKLIDKELSS